MSTKPKKKRRPSLASRLRKYGGFDLAFYDRSSGYTRPKCSCCEVLVINGVATHETFCPNQPKDDDED